MFFLTPAGCAAAGLTLARLTTTTTTATTSSLQRTDKLLMHILKELVPLCSILATKELPSEGADVHDITVIIRNLPLSLSKRLGDRGI